MFAVWVDIIKDSWLWSVLQFDVSCRKSHSYRMSKQTLAWQCYKKLPTEDAQEPRPRTRSLPQHTAAHSYVKMNRFQLREMEEELEFTGKGQWWSEEKCGCRVAANKPPVWDNLMQCMCGQRAKGSTQGHQHICSNTHAFYSWPWSLGVWDRNDKLFISRARWWKSFQWDRPCLTSTEWFKTVQHNTWTSAKVYWAKTWFHTVLHLKKYYYTQFLLEPFWIAG